VDELDVLIEFCIGYVFVKTNDHYIVSPCTVRIEQGAVVYINIADYEPVVTKPDIAVFGKIRVYETTKTPAPSLLKHLSVTLRAEKQIQIKANRKNLC
jgi:hypothetical protein